MPIVRAMPLVYPNDLKVADNSRQFMFGEHFLTAAFSSKIYLPEGNWIDFWTGKKYNGNQDVEPEIPASKGGPLFVKAGAIIPCQKNMRYSNEFSNDTIILKIYPHGKSSFTLLEDDGTSFDYETGKLARTDISCNLNNDVVNITISKRRGTYTDMPVHRYFRIELYSVTPEAVCINGRCLEAKDLLVNNDVVSCLVQTE
jgi:alpha-glucosidase (family GH31 glycosyl hydrolase)